MRLSKKTAAVFLGSSLFLFSSLGIQTPISVAAASILNEFETETLNNNSFENARYLSVSSLINKTYDYQDGNFYGTDDMVDLYQFSVNNSTGVNGRIALKLEGIPVADNYELVLYDVNGNVIDSSRRTSNSNEIIRIPKASSLTTYYIAVIPYIVSSYVNSDYHIVVDNYIETGSKTVSLTPTQVVSTSNVWSTDATYNAATIPTNAVVTSATIQASKSTLKNDYGNQLRVSIGGSAYEVVDWKTGAIALPDLVGANASGYWRAGFKATEIPVLVSGKMMKYGNVIMKDFKMTVNYEYDKLTKY